MNFMSSCSTNGTPPVAFAWAKHGPQGTLSLPDHGTDVAAVMSALLAQGWAKRFGNAGRRVLNDGEIERFIALAFLHDLGKTNRGFWLRQFEGRPMIGHTDIVLSFIGGHDGLAAVLAPLAPLGDDLFFAMLAHHGRPVSAPSDAGRSAHHWNAGPDYDPLAELRALIELARARFPLAFDETLPQPSAGMVALFAGLLTLADWIGSDPDRFPIDGVTGRAREVRSIRVAREAVRKLGLGDASALAGRVPSFTEVFKVASPREAQARAGETALGTLTLLEAETGSGKTEAALWRFLTLLSAGEVDALVFALPTRTSATAMFERVRTCLDGAFGPGRVPPVQAVPGYLRAGALEGERVGRFDVLWPDRETDRLEDACWAAETSKRYLAARVAVGTVDQVLLSGLRTRHAHFRAACLSRALLVVDEVHASDTYMSTVLARVLANHRAVGGHAMLLSATLGARARTAFFEGLRATPPPLDACLATPYPALTGSDAGLIPVRANDRRKRIDITLAPEIAAPEAIARRALAAAASGARVLVLRNTVADAVDTLRALEAGGDAALVFALDGVATLHHGRFAPEDRKRLDAAIEAAFGKSADRSGGGVVVVGTQTLEISLDIDADLMITDLAPMDVLLQRFRRLHRHDGRKRPEGFEIPRAVVCVPLERDLSGLGGHPRHGLGPQRDGAGVYANLPALEATWRLLSERAALVVPDDNRMLVERTTHPEALDAIVHELSWEKLDAVREGLEIYEYQLGLNQSFPLSTTFTELMDCPFPSDEAIRTRLGEDDRRVEFSAPLTGPFGTPVSVLNVPGWMARAIPLEAEPTGIATFGGAFSFALGAERFVYDRYGLSKSN